MAAKKVSASAGSRPAEVQAVGIDVIRFVTEEEGIRIDQHGPFGGDHLPDPGVGLDDGVVGDAAVARRAGQHLAPCGSGC